MIVQVKLSVRKLKKLDDPEARLRRAVLINNTLLCLRRGDGEVEKGRERDTGKEVLPPSNEYRTSLEKALPGGEGLCWSRGDDRGQWTEEKDEWKMEEQVREEEHLREDEHLKEEEHFRGTCNEYSPTPKKGHFGQSGPKNGPPSGQTATYRKTKVIQSYLRIWGTYDPIESGSSDHKKWGFHRCN